ncbi:MAG: T9SS type A sorting domain-containing protein, partial [Ferruginibacter sp.]
VNYQLFNGASPAGSAVAGTGAAISFGSQATAGNYTVVATNTTTLCTNNMTGSTSITINPLPTTFNVTGGGAYCSGGSGVAVGLSGSQSGVNYQLFKGASPAGSAVAGTGAAISFGNQTGAGTYTVVATNGTTSCTNNMTGNVAVSINPLPTVAVTPPSATICAGNSTSLTASGALSYSWSPATGLSATTGSTITANPATTTTYTVTGTDINTCVNSTAVTVTVNPNQICAKYNGDYFANTASTTTGGEATVTLIYNITGSSSPDCNDISNLTENDFGITFTADPSNTTVTPVAGSKSYSGGKFTIQYKIVLPPAAYSAGVEFTLTTSSKYTIDGNCSDNPLVTVSTRSDGFVTGGGFIIPTKSGGTAGKTIGGPAVDGLKNNFGFNLKFNKAGKLQGNWNTIIRRIENGKVVIYQVKSNYATNLVITKISATSYRADMSFKSANFKNLTCSLCPLDANNGTVLVTVYDNGEPGSGIDKILITIKDKDDNIWYTSDKDANHSIVYTNLQLLNAGNIQIHTQGGPAARIALTDVITVLPMEMTLKAVPNPTASSFQIQLPNNNMRDRMQVRIMDISGRAVQVFDKLTPGQTLRVGGNYHAGVYIVEVMQGNKKQQLKVVKF